MDLNPETTALLVVDMQYRTFKYSEDFISNALATLIAEIRAAQIQTVHILSSSVIYDHPIGPIRYDGDKDWQSNIQSQSPTIIPRNAEFVPAAYPMNGEYCYGKTTWNAFRDGDFLKQIAAETQTKFLDVIIAGMWYECCVLSTAFGAKQNNYRVTIPKETTNFDPQVLINDHDIHSVPMNKVLMALRKNG